MIKKQLYRIKMAGLGTFCVDAAYILCDKLRGQHIHPPERIEGPWAERVLYVYSGYKWAIYNVGQVWFKDLGGTMVDVAWLEQNPGYARNFSVVWYGYMWLMQRCLCAGVQAGRIVCSVHDPMEIFAENPAWKQQVVPETIGKSLATADTVVVTSAELFAVLDGRHKALKLVPTTGVLPIRNPSEITWTERIKVLTVGRVYRRKNYELLRQIHRECRIPGVTFAQKLSHRPISDEHYRQLLDHSQIYLCTSYQEGGPLPAMDAMLRGQAVLTTPVGQIQELVQVSGCGYICTTAGEFLDKLHWLSQHPDALLAMRLKALQAITSLRSAEIIKTAVERVLVG
ncbi:MAG: glycosyltransferase [Phycisphaerae bacterium]